MKAAIIYASVHHGNTKKVLHAMQKIKKFDLVKASECKDFDFMISSALLSGSMPGISTDPSVLP